MWGSGDSEELEEKIERMWWVSPLDRTWSGGLHQEDTSDNHEAEPYNFQPAVSLFLQPELSSRWDVTPPSRDIVCLKCWLPVRELSTTSGQPLQSPLDIAQVLSLIIHDWESALNLTMWQGVMLDEESTHNISSYIYCKYLSKLWRRRHSPSQVWRCKYKTQIAGTDIRWGGEGC